MNQPAQGATTVRPGANIKVIGVGGGGTNAINTMICAGVESVGFVAANTDMQSLTQSQSPIKIQVGKELTKGLGAGADPDIGRDATLEDRHEIMEAIGDADMVFVTAGMGGGTGTGGAAVVAQIAREQGALTVGVVTKPFQFEGRRRARHAEIGIERLRENVDTLLVIPNQRLLETATADMSLLDAFKSADNVLLDAVRGISDIINIPGTVNVDFADVKTVMSQMGRALMGIGFASGDNRAVEAATEAISSPLLDNVDIEGATGVLINITASPRVGILELNEACSVIHEAAHEEANIIMGAVIDESMEESIRVTVIATGFAVDDDVRPSPSSLLRPKKSVLSNMHEELRAMGNPQWGNVKKNHASKRSGGEGTSLSYAAAASSLRLREEPSASAERPSASAERPSAPAERPSSAPVNSSFASGAPSEMSERTSAPENITSDKGLSAPVIPTHPEPLLTTSSSSSSSIAPVGVSSQDTGDDVLIHAADAAAASSHSVVTTDSSPRASDPEDIPLDFSRSLPATSSTDLRDDGASHGIIPTGLASSASSLSDSSEELSGGRTAVSSAAPSPGVMEERVGASAFQSSPISSHSFSSMTLPSEGSSSEDSGLLGAAARSTSSFEESLEDTPELSHEDARDVVASIETSERTEDHSSVRGSSSSLEAEDLAADIEQAIDSAIMLAGGRAGGTAPEGSDLDVPTFLRGQIKTSSSSRDPSSSASS